MVDSMLDDLPLIEKFEAPRLLVEKVSQFLTEPIIEGQLRPGQSLSEVDLNKTIRDQSIPNQGGSQNS